MKIVFTGPESTGKTTLAEWLSNNLSFSLVPEIARSYLTKINGQYSADHIKEIGLLQYDTETASFNSFENIVCDTDLLTILIWQEVKFGINDAQFFEWWINSDVTLYFLCCPDIPWESDPFREHPNEREALFKMYEDKLILYGKPFIKLSGNIHGRQSVITQAISDINSKLLNSNSSLLAQ